MFDVDLFEMTFSTHSLISVALYAIFSIVVVKVWDKSFDDGPNIDNLVSFSMIWLIDRYILSGQSSITQTTNGAVVVSTGGHYRHYAN